jgi:hypothetical protein
VEVLLRLAALLERSGKRTEAATLRKRAGCDPVILPKELLLVVTSGLLKFG